MTALNAELRAHPASLCAAIRRFRATVEPASWPRELAIRFRVEGDLTRLRLPLPALARRSDGLWQHTCFEAFLRADASDSYHEFNFAPSGDWAAYRFGGRRSDRSLPDMPAPRIALARHAEHCVLTADVAISTLPELAGARFIHAGLAAVIATEDEGLSYWALAHAGGQPDFHDPATFTMRVALP
jgi:hypothetical protein